MRYLTGQLREKLFPGTEVEPFTIDIPGIYLENQRSEVPWIFRQVNMQILKEHFLGENRPEDYYQYASHLLHLLQFTGRIVNKLQAGNDLVDCISVLDDSQSHEIVQELVRGIEMGDYAVSWYIPRFLGRIYLKLAAEERISLLEHFRELIGVRNEPTIIIALETLGVILHRLPPEELAPGGALREEADQIEGMLCCGLVHYSPEVVEEALYIVGHAVFGYEKAYDAQKEVYFADLCRKILASVNAGETGLYNFYHAAALNHIYRFLSDHIHSGRSFPEEEEQKVAFFPGTFDPFSLGHKEIVREIVSMGFRVYLAVDEFSWSKKTQPWYIRRKIVEMSVADIKDAYLFPEEIPVNIANPVDLHRLADVFPGKEVYLVAGSDVLTGASAYRKPKEPWSVHSFPHILFVRNTDPGAENSGADACLDKGVQWLKLPAYFENMSSTRIRENVGGRKDITNLVEKTVQNYIYDNSLYVREPIYKRTARSRETDIEHYNALTEELADELRTSGLMPEAQKCGDEVVILREKGIIIGIALFHRIGVTEFYRESGDLRLAEQLRQKLEGKVAVLTALAGIPDEDRDPAQEALNEMLAWCQAEHYSHSVCFCAGGMQSMLELQGFLPFRNLENCMSVCLSHPLVMISDTLSFLKEPFGDAPAMKKVIQACHKKMQRAITGLYPGELVLSFDAESLNYRIIRKIRENNPFPEVQYTDKKLAADMCVPFGKTMKSVVVPECVTKSLYTEKAYSVDTSSFVIREFPHYAPLPVQMRTIRSFDRPVILIDDFFHKGYRMKEILGILEKEGITLRKLAVGVMSGRGRDLAESEQLPVESVYFVPNMRTWLVESDLYPFIGGDGIQDGRKERYRNEVLPSFNGILPYQVPSYLEEASMEGFYRMSQICFENAEQICRELEKEYQQQYGRKLTMARFSEAVAEPRHPDTAELNEETLQMSPSALIRRELQKLSRHRHLLDGRFRP